MKNLVMLFSILLSCMYVNAQQVAKSLKASNGTVIGFYEYKPTNYTTNPANKYPLIIFLHGNGERGNGTTDLPMINRNGITRNIATGHKMTFTWNGKTETFLVLAPQLDLKYTSWPGWYVDAMVQYAKANLNVDTDRIIVTGLSLGGGGTWRYAAENATFTSNLAAIGVSCGTAQGVDFGNIARANLPVWAFHAENDPTVAVSATYNSINKINAANPAVVPYMTIWPTGGHTIWTRVFDTTYAWQNPNIYEWFLAQNKSLAPNKRPVAKAGGTINHPSASMPLTLNASSSTDADGKLVRFIWRQISGPSTSAIATPVSTNGVSNVTGLASGTYKYEVKVVDERADWTFDTVTVNVAAAAPLPNDAPVAKAGADATITLPTSSVTLNGSASTDSDGSISSYKWAKVSGPASATITSPTKVSTTVTALVEGTYTFELTVTDNGGATGKDQVVVTVKAAVANDAPTANAGPNITITLPDNSIGLSGSGKDADGSIASYSWKKLSGPTTFTIASESSASTDVSNLVEGTYVFRLTVKDNLGASATDDIAVYVKKGTGVETPAPNVPPTAKAGDDMTIVLPDNSATLDASASTDSDGSISSYSWVKINGPSAGVINNASASTTAVSGLAQGTYTFEVTVTDNSGAKNSDQVIVFVKSNAAPSAKAGANITITLPTNAGKLDGSASTDDVSIASYAWSKMSGPAAYLIANKMAAKTDISGLVEGTYVFRLTVTDNSGLSSFDDIAVYVKQGAVQSKAPVAAAGLNVTLNQSTNSTELNGSASFDEDGSIVSYQWRRLSGPSSFNISTPNGVTTAVTGLVEGTYVFRLTVKDNSGLSSYDDIAVYVKAQAQASAMQQGAQPNEVMAQNSSKENIAVYPNPARGNLNVQLSGPDNGNVVVNVYDVSGKMVSKVPMQKSQQVMTQQLDVSKLNPGFYNIEAIVNGKVKVATRFVKQ